MSQNKNIVVLADGTWSGPNARTNIYALFNELINNDYEQHAKYFDGVGIGEFGLEFVIDGAIALSLDKRIKDAYKYIVNLYNPGDDIWLFGFSRGAYTVRCVAGMIQNCGILRLDRVSQAGQLDQVVDLAYNIYRNRGPTFKPNGDGTQDFKTAFSYPDNGKPPVKFLGVLETVGAHGIPAFVFGEGIKYLEFHDLIVPNVVKHARQASAIHERVSVLEACRIGTDNKSTVDIKETWFPGLHTEIGGGSSFIIGGNERISKATLLWMIEEIVSVGGLLMKNDILNYRNRFSPDTGPSWNLGTIIVDRSSGLIPAVLHRDRIIPLDKDSEKPNMLKRDHLYRNGDWTIAFGDRKNLSRQYHSATYENLREDMVKQGIRLYDDVRYDMIVDARL